MLTSLMQLPIQLMQLINTMAAVFKHRHRPLYLQQTSVQLMSVGRAKALGGEGIVQVSEEGQVPRAGVNVVVKLKQAIDEVSFPDKVPCADKFGMFGHIHFVHSQHVHSQQPGWTMDTVQSDVVMPHGAPSSFVHSRPFGRAKAHVGGGKEDVARGMN